VALAAATAPPLPQPLRFFSCRLSATETNFTFNWELLAAQAAINHFLPQVEGWQFLLLTDPKPLVATMTSVTPLALGRLQQHLALIAEHKCNMLHTPVVDNVVAEPLLQQPTSPPPLTILCRNVMRRQWQILDCRCWT
jgi:RNase H-like domain found in reverse transcriptase